MTRLDDGDKFQISTANVINIGKTRKVFRLSPGRGNQKKKNIANEKYSRAASSSHFLAKRVHLKSINKRRTRRTKQYSTILVGIPVAFRFPLAFLATLAHVFIQIVENQVAIKSI